MNLRTYYQTLDAAAREAFARACGTTLGHLRNVAYGKQCNETLAMNIERESKRAVTCEELRPDLTEQWTYLRNTAAVDAEIHPVPDDREAA